MCAEELGFIEKYDLLGCIQCGRCTGGCPVAMRTDLRVRGFMYDTLNEELLEEISEKPEIWDCTTCFTCAARCPKGLEPLEVLIGLRGLQIEEGRVQPTDGNLSMASLYGSILPAAWSLMLALRSRGLGAAWTTLHLRYEEEVANILGIPNTITQVALLPVAYFTGTDFKPAKRVPAQERTYWDGWGQLKG